MAPERSTTPAAEPTQPLDHDRIVAIAGDFVDEHGPEELTLTKIAEQLGVTQPALYRHLGGLSDLWRALGISTRDMLADVLAEASVGRSGTDALRAVAEAWRAFAMRHPGRYRSTDRYAVAGDASLEEAAHRTISVLARSLQGFELSPDATIAAAGTVRAALHGFASYEVGDGHPDPASVDASFDDLIDHLCLAFSSPQLQQPLAKEMSR